MTAAANHKPLIIAEAGVNHNGSERMAIDLVRAAKRTGADIIKFQHFRAETVVARGARTAAYQQSNTGTHNQADLLRGLELDLDVFARIAQVCKDEGISFLCTAFDMAAAADLVEMGMPFIKIPSGELTNLPMCRAYARFHLPMLLSTGMGTMEEVKTALDTLIASGAPEVTLLQCTSLYPAPPESLNLKAIVTMRERFGRPVGFSDHSLGDHAAIAAVALGATVIEKHFTLDCSLPGPDHRASLEPDAFALMVQRIAEVAVMLGDGVKRLAPGEAETASLVRRSWHAARDLPAGAVLEGVDVVLKRPADGLAPAVDIVGKRLTKAVARDQPISAAIVEQ